MSTSTPSSLEQTIRESGEGWILDHFHPAENAVPRLLQTLAAVQEAAVRRLGDEAPTISEEVLLEEYRRNPQRVRAFFQALAGTRSPEMLVMVWRILQGMEVREIEMNYRRQQSFEVRVVLESADGKADEPYVSTNIKDFALFRHIGLMEVANTPVFSGFYPLRIRGISS